MSAKPSPRIAYQGVPGAFSEIAAKQFAPDAEAVGFRTFSDAFMAATSGEFTHVCLPVENSLAGSINQSYDLLRDSVLHVVSEQIVRVRHNLLARKGVRLEDVKRVYSHPQALEQCAGFLARHGLEGVVDFDTAGAAKLLSENGANDRAAIASLGAAEHYGLDVLATDIEDLDFNYTRFFVLGPEEAEFAAGPRKSSLILATKHRPGDLVECLQQFPEHGVNMTKLESRPRRDKPWSYLFYIDIEGDISEPNVAAALTGIMRRAAMLKFLGSYPAAEVQL